VPSDLVAGRPDFFSVGPAAAPAAREVAPGVWMSPGLSNAWLVVTDEGRVVVNTGMGFEAVVHRRNFDAVDRGPVRYVLLTQGHVDHVGGVDRFREPGTIVVAQAANPQCQADDARIHAFRVRRSLPFFAAAIGLADDFIRSGGDVSGVPPQSQAVPDVLFDDTYEFRLGGRHFELLATPGGETVDSMVVWMPEQRVAIVGNLFSALFGHVPNLVTMRGDRYRFALPFVESLERVRALGAEVLCVGHHEPVRGTAVIDRELTRIRDAVLHLHDATVAAMNEGDDVWHAMASIRLPEDLALGEGYGTVAWSVRAIWEGYAGWFHHRSTRELYGAPPEHGDAELVALAGGPAPVLARARQALADGDPLLAIRLGEAARCATAAGAAPSGEPVDGARDADTLALLLEAHEALLERDGGENFWLTRWLEYQRRVLNLTAETARTAGGPQ
jgi:alkyl sulfatase BDS1-like metallo-beta-lactamase superfamily hydrolase